MNLDSSHRPPYPHYAWFAHWTVVSPPRVFDIHESRSVGHRVVLGTEGEADIRFATRWAESVHHLKPGDIVVVPCDRRLHVISYTTADNFRAYNLLLDVQDMPVLSVPCSGVSYQDALMEASLLRLSTKGGGHELSEDIGDDIAARQILMRLCALTGATPPAWSGGAVVFPPDVIRQIVARIDESLACQLSLETLAGIFDLSPGHFARKFHESVGLSPGRFVNKRRIRRSFAMLRDESLPLARIALDLGFSSQSHFTRVFSMQTGFSPQRFRRLQARSGDECEPPTPPSSRR